MKYNKRETYEWLKAYFIIACCAFSTDDVEELANMSVQMYCSNTLNLTDKVEFSDSVVRKVECYVNAELQEAILNA